MKNLALRSVLVASLFLGSNAYGKSQDERRASQEVFINQGDEPPSMDPTKQVDATSGLWLGHLFEGLMTKDKTGKVVPGTAEKVAVSADGKTYTFTIRKSAKWHDGKAVSAKDFEFAFRRLVDPAYASEYSFIAETAQFLNASEIIAKKSPIESLGVKAIDDSTLEIKLSNPVAFFPALMTFQSFFPVRQDVVQKFGDKFATSQESIVGNGPFKMDKWQKETSMRIVKADTYWNKDSIKLNAIAAPVIIKDAGASYNTYRTGGLDVVGLDSERLKLALKDKQAVKSTSDGAVHYIEMNAREGKVFANKKLRQAVKFAINRTEFVNKISAIPGDKQSFGLIPDYMPGSKSGSTYRQEIPMKWKDNDLAMANKLVAEYLAETKQSKVPTFTILAGDSTTAKRDVEYFQSALTKIFKTEIRVDTVPFKTRLQKSRDGQFDMVLSIWGPDFLDAMTFADLFSSGNGNNHTGWGNPKYDELVKKARTTVEMGERVKMFAEMEKILADEVPMAPFYQRGRAYLQAKGLQGVRRDQVGTDPDYRFASWSTAAAKK